MIIESHVRSELDDLNYAADLLYTMATRPSVDIADVYAAHVTDRLMHLESPECIILRDSLPDNVDDTRRFFSELSRWRKSYWKVRKEITR